MAFDPTVLDDLLLLVAGRTNSRLRRMSDCSSLSTILIDEPSSRVMAPEIVASRLQSLFSRLQGQILERRPSIEIG